MIKRSKVFGHIFGICVLALCVLPLDGQGTPSDTSSLLPPPSSPLYPIPYTLYPSSSTYLSPNNDGIQDTLTVPVSIKDKRYIEEWKFVVEDENKTAVRTILNKETRPAKMSFETIWKALTTPKRGVAVPQSVTWDGTLDSGETAPDGLYHYYVAASDDNGNYSESERYLVVVDNTPPEIELTQPEQGDKFFGEGAKATLRIPQRGSVEDLWVGTFANAKGNIVRVAQWKNSAPEEFVWDGKNNGGTPVADGVYSYSVEAADRAGNKSAPARVANIIYSADQPVTNITINGSRYFSPRTASPRSSVTFDLVVPEPGKAGDADATNWLEGWSVDILDQTDQVRKTFSGITSAPAQLVFNGLDQQDQALADGNYYARLRARYHNGYETPYIRSNIFTVDRTPPRAALTVRDTLFSPNGDGDRDTVTLNQNLSAEDTAWRGEIVSSAGTTVKRFDLGGRPQTALVWNGQNDAGKICDDGQYTYRVTNTDQAGNTCTVISGFFELNTGETEVNLAFSPEVFSPNGDGVQDTIIFTPLVKSSSGISSYTLEIQNLLGESVKTFRAGSAMPAAIVWDGKNDAGIVAGDGAYIARLNAESRNGTKTGLQTQRFYLDTSPPQAAVSAPYTLFSPDADGKKDTLPFAITTSVEKRWTGTIEGSGGKTIREYVWYNTRVPAFEWDGADESGNTAPDGSYRLTLSSTDEGGNRGVAALAGITIDTRPVRGWVTAEQDVISPIGRTREQHFTLSISPADGIETWTFDIIRESDTSLTPVQRWGNTVPDTAMVPDTIVWNGRTSAGSAFEGSFTGVLRVVYRKGAEASFVSAPFLCTSRPPVLSVQSEPLPFSPDNDGENDELTISLRAESLLPFSSWSFTVFDPQNRKPFWTAGGNAAITPKLVWGGRGNVAGAGSGELVQSAMEYPYTFTVTDTQGLSSSADGLIPIDVLVIRDGDALKIQIPAIIFRANKADFAGKDADPKDGLEEAVIDNNIRVLRRTAEILAKFRDYSITIEGHANSVTGTEAEETASTLYGQPNIPLVPLSQERAEFVKAQLVRMGIGASRLKTQGLGGRRPVAPLADRDNWWKNRRVEFILNK
jgi:flagellar hook assembly protein FlgD